MRKCKICNEVKPLDQFPTYSANNRRGHRHTCRKCWNEKWSPIIIEHNKRYYHENIKGYRDKQKQRTARNRRRGNIDRYRAFKDYEMRHPDRAKAKCAVMIAIRSGLLKKQPCQICGAKTVHAHHDNYEQPLKVIWLCPEHHGERHRLNNRRPVAGKVMIRGRVTKVEESYCYENKGKTSRIEYMIEQTRKIMETP